MKQKRVVLVVSIALLVAAAWLSGCIHPRRHPASGPHLPPVVILDDPFYLYGGYYYHYRDDCWYYSRYSSGPWLILPRNRYPREIRYKETYRHRDRVEKGRKPDKPSIPYKPGKPDRPLKPKKRHK